MVSNSVDIELRLLYLQFQENPIDVSFRRKISSYDVPYVLPFVQEGRRTLRILRITLDSQTQLLPIGSNRRPLVAVFRIEKVSRTL
jgi:hypothetical protein